jgi:hypothetical protein
MPSSSTSNPTSCATRAIVRIQRSSTVATSAVLVVIAEANESFATSLAYSDRVGPLSGKTIWAVVAYAGSWAILAVALRGRRMSLRAVAVLAGLLLALALVGTFSPFFELFKSE